ncbi:hypothetical protein GCM10007301_09080 [Azorhizobium oxalatiphilum]|uniref:Transmembrane protein n=1 Tax=Azorhizobium oxalatiphilum TaxID=980631 RepID=A0A917F5G3_9HYPH|nr:hypothetical protein [Azorhizobium oxalatiphilum]GGF51826.1 hypothetical protein GCM10007301_09080 [Azorhizobium oxalatiphilum]
MTLRTAIILRHAALGVAIALALVAYNLTRNGDVTPARILGQIVGGGLVVGLLGYVRSRKAPAEARTPPLTTARRITLTLCLVAIPLLAVAAALIFKGVIHV